MKTMKSATLDEFFRTIGPFLEGRTEHAAVAAELYGGGAANGIDARRLAVYGRFCRAHRFEALDRTFFHCREAVVEHGGDAAWAALVEEYFRAHPMRHFELNENGAAFPDFLAAGAGAVDRALPSWLPQLADYEWWEWRTRSALDAPEDSAAGGPLRIASTVELRPYGWDFAAWLDVDKAARLPAPQARAVLMLFWRDPYLELRSDRAAADELAVLKLVSDGAAIDSSAARALGVQLDVLLTARDRLREAGVLVGAE